MLKKMVFAAAALALSAPAFADRDHGRQHYRKDITGHRSYYAQHQYRPQHHYHHHRPVVVMPPPRVVYVPPRVVYHAPAPVYYYQPPAYHASPFGGISIRFNFPL